MWTHHFIKDPFHSLLEDVQNDQLTQFCSAFVQLIFKDEIDYSGLIQAVDNYENDISDLSFSTINDNENSDNIYWIVDPTDEPSFDSCIASSDEPHIDTIIGCVNGTHLYIAWEN